MQAIIDQVNNNSLDRQTAASQIDAILTPSEAQAVLAQGTRMRDAMRQIFAQNAQQGGQSGPGGFGQNGPNGQRDGGNQNRRTPDAGRTLLMLGRIRQGPQQRPN